MLSGAVRVAEAGDDKLCCWEAPGWPLALGNSHRLGSALRLLRFYISIFHLPACRVLTGLSELWGRERQEGLGASAFCVETLNSISVRPHIHLRTLFPGAGA